MAASAPLNAFSAAPAEEPLAAEGAKAATGGEAPTASPIPRPLAVGPQRAAISPTATLTATPVPSPTAAASPSTAPPAPRLAAPTRWGWRLAEGVLAALAIVLGFLGWRRR